MNLAITLLVTVGIASIVGSVPRQNDARQNYIIKFGPFWFEVFSAPGFYDVYSVAWFLLILYQGAAGPAGSDVCGTADRAWCRSYTRGSRTGRYIL
jgi:hypothetical protein